MLNLLFISDHTVTLILSAYQFTLDSQSEGSQAALEAPPPHVSSRGAFLPRDDTWETGESPKALPGPGPHIYPTSRQSDVVNTCNNEHNMAGSPKNASNFASQKSASQEALSENTTEVVL